jgi:hypothetical protein
MLCASDKRGQTDKEGTKTDISKPEKQFLGVLIAKGNNKFVVIKGLYNT